MKRILLLEHPRTPGEDRQNDIANTTLSSCLNSGYLAAVLLPRPYAMAAAALGGGLADLLTAPVWAPATVIIKMLIVLPFTSQDGRILSRRNLAAPFLALTVSATGYYLAEGILFGSFLAPIVSLTGSFIQSTGSAVIFLILGASLDKVHLKAKTQHYLYQ